MWGEGQRKFFSTNWHYEVLTILLSLPSPFLNIGSMYQPQLIDTPVVGEKTELVFRLLIYVCNVSLGISKVRSERDRKEGKIHDNFYFCLW